MSVPSFVVVIITTVLVVNASIITEDPPLCALLDAATQCENSEISKICTKLCTKVEDSPLCILLDAATQCHNAEIAKICTNLCKPARDPPLCALLDAATQCENAMIANKCKLLCTAVDGRSKVGGSWGSWQSWSSCSKSCGEGTKQRHRHCDDPNGGLSCPGLPKSEDSCNTIACVCDPDCVNGECVGTKVCKCNDGWEGDICDNPICHSNCVNGNCTEHNVCTCEDGWEGKLCGEPICDHECENGECVRPNTCECKDGWQGDLCQDSICLPNCLHGNCTNPNECTCDDGWEGDICDEHPICKKTILGLQKKVEEGLFKLPTLDEISANCTSITTEELIDCSTGNQLDFIPCAYKLQDCFPGRILPENLHEGCIKEILTTVKFPGLEELIAGLCNAPWIQIVSECFRIHSDKASWQQARDNCQREGGDLAQPNNLQALRTYLEDNSITQDYWLGGRLNSGEGWYWLSGRAIIDPFSVGQPSGDGDCLDFRSSNNPSLYDHNCAFSQLYICESGEESVTNPSTRVSPEYISRK